MSHQGSAGKEPQPTVSEEECERWRELSARGLSNAEIAEEAAWVKGTVEKHVAKRCPHERPGAYHAPACPFCGDGDVENLPFHMRSCDGGGS